MNHIGKRLLRIEFGYGQVYEDHPGHCSFSPISELLAGMRKPGSSYRQVSSRFTADTSLTQLCCLQPLSDDPVCLLSDRRVFRLNG
jgi:hypothetical protein